MSARDIVARIITPKDIQILHQECVAAGVDASKIQPDNPFKKSGGTAAMLQAAVVSIDPEQAAKWRMVYGSGLSVATMDHIAKRGSDRDQSFRSFIQT